MHRDVSTPRPGSEIDPAVLFRTYTEAPDGIAWVDREGRYVEVNATFCEIVGHRREALLGSSFADLLVPHERPRLATTRATLRDGATDRGEWRIRHGGGGEATVEVSTRVLEGGQWLTFVRDVSARRFAEDARRQSADASEAERQWLETIIDTVPLGVLLFGPGERLRFNRRAEELLGTTLSPTGGSAQYRSRILFPDGAPVPEEQMISTRVLRKGETFSAVELLIERPDGVRIPILGSAAPIRDAAGAIIGGVGVFQDITELRRAQEAIRANERLLDGIFELLPIGVWIADHEGRIVRTNPAGLRIWGGARYVAPPEFAEYRGWWVDTGEPIAAEDWALSRALRNNETSIGELLRIQAFDGTFKTVLNSALPLHDEQGCFVGAIAINEDVTGLRTTQEDLERAVQARDEILRIVSHDLCNPLQVIVLAAQHIDRELEARASVEELRATTDRILRVTGRMARLIDDLLDIASIDAGQLGLEPSRLDVGTLVHEAVDVHQAQASARGIALSVDSRTDTPIQADRDRMLQALSNLVGNALKFTPAGGTVSVRTSDDEDAVRFSIVDSGPGLAHEELDRAFEPFWQSKPADARGRGLGLAITKAIVEAHGGRIWLESERGRGTTACFTVPRSAAIDVAPAAASGKCPGTPSVT